MFRDTAGHVLFADPATLEDRADVLVYTSTPFAEQTEVTGPVKLTLYAATSAVDTDFFCRLSDMDADGHSLQLTNGIVRARFRHGRTPEPVTPGEIVEYEIDLGAIAYAFPAGHRIRIDLSSSSFPAHDRNLNTGERIGHGTYSVKADQMIYHDAQHPSHLLLPVIPE